MSEKPFDSIHSVYHRIESYEEHYDFDGVYKIGNFNVVIQKKTHYTPSSIRRNKQSITDVDEIIDKADFFIVFCAGG